MTLPVSAGGIAIRPPDENAQIRANGITANAPIILLSDMHSGQTLIAKNDDRRFMPASMTKVMSLYVAFDLIKQGKLSPDTEMVFSDKAAEEWERKGSTLFLKAGERVSVDTLLRGIASVSANDGAIVLAEGALGSVDAWTKEMNRTAYALGMYDSHFATPNGWPDDGATFTTARDLETLAQHMILKHGDLYREYIGKPGFSYNGFAQANHDPISGVIEGADGIKTGFTKQAGNGFLGSAERDGTRLIMVIGGVDEEPVRNQMARDLMEWGYDGFERQTIFPKGTSIGAAQVQNGAADHVQLVTATPIIATMPKGPVGLPKLTIRYDGPLRAPIKIGERVAHLQITTPGMTPASFPLETVGEVDEADFFERIRNGFMDWFG